MREIFSNYLIKIGSLFALAFAPVILIFSSQKIQEGFAIFLVWFCLILIFAIVLIFIIKRRKNREGRQKAILFYLTRALLFCLYSCALTYFACVAIIKNRPAFATTSDCITTLRGHLLSPVVEQSSNIKLYLALSESDFSLQKGAKANLTSSAKGRLTVFIKKSDQIRNLETQKWLAGDEVEVTNVSFLSRKSGELCFAKNVISKNRNFYKGKNRTLYSFYKTLSKIRLSLYQWAKESGEVAGLSLALIDGERVFADEAIKRAYAASGMSHLLALSGMHLGVISTLFLLLLRPILGKRATLFIVGIVTILYAIFAGASASLVRAAIMMSLLILFKLKGGRVDMLLVLFISLPISLFLQPDFYNSAALILSYLALFGLLVFSEFLSKLFSYLLPKKIASGLGASYSCSVTTALWTLQNFGFVASGGLIGSIVLAPITFVIMGVGFLSAFFYLIKLYFFSNLFLGIARIFYEINRVLLLFFASFPKATTYWHLLLFFSPILVLFFYSFVINFLSANQRRFTKEQFSKFLQLLKISLRLSRSK